MSEFTITELPVTFFKPTFCPHCNSESIELFDDRQRGLKYGLMVAMNDFKS